MTSLTLASHDPLGQVQPAELELAHAALHVVAPTCVRGGKPEVRGGYVAAATTEETEVKGFRMQELEVNCGKGTSQTHGLQVCRGRETKWPILVRCR